MSSTDRPILVVDDEESIRRSTCAYLADEGFDVIDAESGEKALKIMGLIPVAAAIVDIRLPGMDGNTFIERAYELDSNLGILILTGSTDYKPPDGLSILGVNEANIFFKPLGDMAVLTAALTTILYPKKK